MSQSVQNWILRQKGFVNFINVKLGERGGVIGRIFSPLKIGKRQMGAHTLPKLLKFFNYYLVHSYGLIASVRPIFSRYLGVTHGPLNYTGLMMWCLMTGAILNRIRFHRSRDIVMFNNEDGAEFWFKNLGILFPPNYLNNKLSAHYIEINQIYSYEMFKKYRKVRTEMLLERDELSDKERRTRYITNPNYVYEPLGKDTNIVKNVHFDL